MSRSASDSQDAGLAGRGWFEIFCRWHLGLVLILVLAAGLRVYALGRAPLWTDELFSLQSTAGRGFWVEQLPTGVVMSPATRPTELVGAGSVADIYWSQSLDTHPPLFFMLLRIVRELFGSSAEALRSISVVASVATVAAMYVAGSAVGGGRRRTVALIAAGLTAVAASQIAFAQEARGYAMATALVAACAAAALRVRDSGWTTGRAIVLGSCATVALGTLYLAAIPLLAISVYLAVEVTSQRRNTWIVLGVTAVVAMVLWGPLLYEQRHNVGLRNQWLVSATPRTVGAIAKDVAQALMSQVGRLQDRSLPAAYFAAVVLAVSAVPLYLRVPATRLWLLWLGAVFAALAAMDFVGNKTHLQLARYTLLSGPALFGLLASLVTIRRGAMWLWGSIPLAAILLAGLSLTETYRSTKEDWNIVRDYVRKGNARPTDLFVVAATGHVRWEDLLYLGLCRNIEWPSFSAAIVTSATMDLTAIREEAARRGGITLLVDYDTDMSSAIPAGYVREDRFTNVPSVGILASYRPAQPSRPSPPPAAAATGPASRP